MTIDSKNLKNIIEDTNFDLELEREKARVHTSIDFRNNCTMRIKSQLQFNAYNSLFLRKENSTA